MAKYRKKPVVIEAIQWTGANHAEVIDFMSGDSLDFRDEGLFIHTREGDMYAAPGDWIIKGVKGEFYPCKPEIFAQTYEPVEDGRGG